MLALDAADADLAVHRHLVGVDAAPVRSQALEHELDFVLRQLPAVVEGLADDVDDLRGASKSLGDGAALRVDEDV